MADETATVEIGGTEVEINQTEDGFEAVEVADDRSSVRIRATCSGEDFGFEMDINGPYVIGARELDYDVQNDIYAHWDTSEDISDLKDHGTGHLLSSEIPSGYDGRAVVSDVEVIVE